MNTAKKKKKLSPMLTQYLELKEKYSDYLIFFQVGDFYELFFNDAVIAAGALNLTLTSRDKSAAEPIPMCGMPISAIDTYLERLVAQGKSAVIVSQKPVPSNFKGMVPREIERVITPGVKIFSNTPTYSTVAVFAGRSLKDISVSFTDVSIGRVFVKEGLSIDQAIDFLVAQDPAELVVLQECGDLNINRKTSIYKVLDHRLKAEIRFRSLESQSSDDIAKNISGYELFSGSGKLSLRVLFDFIAETSVDVSKAIESIEEYVTRGVASIDTTSARNLELFYTSNSSVEKNSLYGYLNQTKTAGGGRILRSWLASPLTDKVKLNYRYDILGALATNQEYLNNISISLKRCTSIERIATRIMLGIVNPLELGALQNTLKEVEDLKNTINSLGELVSDENTIFKLLKNSLVSNTSLVLLERLTDFLAKNPPQSLRNGGFVKDGFDEEVDRLRNIINNGEQWFLDFAAEQRELTGISSLKIKKNGVLGYFIEVPKSQASKVPENYVTRQNTSSAVRFSHEDLIKAQSEYVNAYDKVVLREKELFSEYVNNLRNFVPFCRSLGEAISILDVLHSFAHVSLNNDFVRPELLEDNSETEIIDVFHPILKEKLANNFIPNSIAFSEDGDSKSSNSRCYVLTGPNMGGKTTFLRSVGLAVIIAQIGCFVPARVARIEIADRIFARIGASDDMLEGDSTFMVEMREAAQFLNRASAKSLILIDEIGRGTSTSDGEALAQAILENLVQKLKARVIFATHFHNISNLIAEKKNESIKSCSNIRVGSVQDGDRVIFNHKIESGLASRSYGLEVATLAGISEEVVTRAKDIIKARDSNSLKANQFPLFTRLKSSSGQSNENLNKTNSDKNHQKNSEEDQKHKKLNSLLAGIDPDLITPRESLDLVYKIKDLITK